MTNLFKAQDEHRVKRHMEFFERPFDSLSLLKLSFITSVSVLGLLGCAQTPVDPATNATPPMMARGMPMGGASGSMAQMDTHVKMMRETHEKMMQASSPAERNALMATNMKQMQGGMAMMGGMGADGMHGKSPMGGDMAARQQMMEKRMEMMQSMMQMMMDRLPQVPSK